MLQVWSVTIRYSLLTTKALIALKAFWWLLSQGRNVWWASLVVHGIKTQVWSTNLGRYTEMYHMSPRKAWTSVADLGTSHFNVLSAFLEFASMPFCEIWCPRKYTSNLNNMHFLSLQYSFLACSTIMTRHMCFKCSLTCLDQIIVSSIYTWQILPIRCLSADCWWIGAHSSVSSAFPTIHTSPEVHWQYV